MSDLRDNRLVRTFAELRAGGGKALAPFLTAGSPDLSATSAFLADWEARGVRVVELGFPFSDPIADGPVIQSSYTHALDAGLKVAEIFEMVRRYRDGGGSMALVAMVSYSLVYRRGVAAFMDQARRAGIDAMLMPDLPLDESASAAAAADERGLANVMLIAPTTGDERRLEIARRSRGFVYYVSVAGTTGERDALPQATIDAVADLRRHVDTPIAVGFGISNPRTVATVCEVADAAIVGSAIVHRISDGKDLPPADLVEKIGQFVSELMQPLAEGA